MSTPNGEAATTATFGDDAFDELLQSLEPDLSHGISCSFPILCIADSDAVASLVAAHLANHPTVARIVNLRIFDARIATEGYGPAEATDALRAAWLRKRIAELEGTYQIVAVVGLRHTAELAFATSASFATRAIAVRTPEEPPLPWPLRSTPCLTVQSPADLRSSLDQTLDRMVLAC